MDTLRAEYRRVVTALQLTGDALAASRERFLRAMHTHDNECKQFAVKAVDRLEEYTEPDRARAIQEAAKRAIRGIQRFAPDEATLVSRVAMLRLQLDASVTLLNLEVLKQGVAAISDPQVSLEDALKGFDEQRLRSIVAAVAAGEMGRAVVRGTDLASAIYELRCGKLAEYVGESSSVRVEDVLNSIVEVTTEQLADEGKSAILELGAKLLGLSIETVLPLGRLATLAFDIRQRAAVRIRTRYSSTPKGDIDGMFDLVDQLEAENEAVEAVSSLLLETAKAIRVPPSGGGAESTVGR